MFVFSKEGIVVAITNDSNGMPNFDSMGTVDDYQKVYVGDHIDNEVTISQNGIKTHCISKLEFMNRFTLEEQISIFSSNDPVVKVLDKQNQTSEFIDLEDPKTQQGVGYLYNVNIITVDRMNEILN